MKSRKLNLRPWLIAVAAVSAIGAGTVYGQAPKAKPAATPTPTAQSNNPEKARSLDQWIADMMKPRPYPKSSIIRIDKDFAYAHKASPWKFRVVKEEGDTVWLQPLPPEDPGSILHTFWLQQQERQARIAFQEQHPQKAKMLDFNAVVPPLPSQDGYHFTVSRYGLPRTGQWRNDFAVADMNEDGKLDLVLPPPREGQFSTPIILLGEGNGKFHQWKGIKWSSKVPFDYGGVAVADFDGDGHRDIVTGIHFKDQYILYGNGKGDFSRSQLLPSPRAEVHSQAVTTADFNGDGRPDIAFLAEVSYDIKTSKTLTVPSVWVLENRGDHKWVVHTKGLPDRIMGLSIEAADINGDGRPDLVLSSNVQDWRNLVMFNECKDGKWNWSTNRVDEVLAGAFHYSVVDEPWAPDQLAAAFQQFELVPRPQGEAKPKTEGRSGLVQYVVAKNGDVSTKVLEMDSDDQRANPWWRLAAGDLNGDGHGDLVALRRQGNVQILLGDGRGGFVNERSPELPVLGAPYAVRIVDLDGDGRGEIILMTAATKKLKGGMAVFKLEDGAAPK